MMNDERKKMRNEKAEYFYCRDRAACHVRYSFNGAAGARSGISPLVEERGARTARAARKLDIIGEDSYLLIEGDGVPR